jgi:hypothetical protein
MYHAVYDKLDGDGISVRPYLNFIFKQAGPPHRFTQPIPSCYPRDTELHRMLFIREAWSPTVWEDASQAPGRPKL